MLCATHRLPEHAPRETGALPRKVRKVVIPFTYIGTHALLMGRLAGPQGRVYAFEPQRKVYRELRRNIELNGLANVTALRYAVGAETRIVEMNPPREIGVVEASGNRLVGKALGEGGVAVGAGGRPGGDAALGQLRLRERLPAQDRRGGLRGRGSGRGGKAHFGSFQRRTMKRLSFSIRSGSVPLCFNIPGMSLFRTPIPRAST